MELLLRIRNWWPVVLSPPRPVKPTPGNQENFIFVASRNRIYEQCPDSLSRYVNLFICRYIDYKIMSPNYRKMSVPRLWYKLRRTFAPLKQKKSMVQRNSKLK
ncbi:hypothetical protein ACLKA6_016692 [Drosophila palustris]